MAHRDRDRLAALYAEEVGDHWAARVVRSHASRALVANVSVARTAASAESLGVAVGI